MRITLRQLDIFLAIADSGTTTAAAERIALSQSAISAAIAELEKLLGVQLFDRLGKRLQLNDHGRALLPQARALVDNARSLEASFNGPQPSLLVLGASLTIGNYLLPGLLADYWRSIGLAAGEAPPPVQLKVANTAEIAAKVANFEVDFGLIEGPCHRPDVELIPWMPDELLLVVGRSHPLASQANQLSLSQLAQAQWLLREPGSGTREALEQLLLPHLHQLKSQFEFNDHQAIKQSAIQGLGIACLSRLMLEDELANGKLIPLNTGLGPLQRQFSILLHRQKQLTPGMKALLDFLRKGNRE